VSVNALAGQPVGSPGCGPANDGNGTATCLLMSETSSGFALQAVSIYPPIGLSSSLQTLSTSLPLGTTLGNPACANAGGNAAVVICALVVNNQVNAIAFRPAFTLTTPKPFTQAALSSPLTPLAGLTGVTGNPSCVNVSSTAVACTIRQGQGLTGFALQFTAGTGNTGSIALTASIGLPPATFSSDPSCAAAATNTALNCGIVSGSNLLGITFDVPAHTAQTSYRSLGPAPGTETWTGKLGCSSFRTVGAQNPHLTGCAIISNAGNLYRITFDPQAGTQLGPHGPFAANVNSSPSCLELFTDMDEMYCGETLTGGTSVGSRLPVGLLNPAAAAAATSVLF
jgi:hypothetical protein